MTHNFNCIATGISSMPGADPDKAVEQSLRYLFEAPIWPQLPQRDFREHMDAQYSESLPGLQIDEAGEKVSFDTTGDLTAALEKFFERYLEKDYGFFRISETYAPGFYALLRALKRGPLPRARYIKGHITGPLTTAQLVSILEVGIRRLVQAGIDPQTILRQSLITPSCGKGSLTPDKDEAILKLLRDVSDRMQEKVV